MSRINVQRLFITYIIVTDWHTLIQ